MAKRNNKNKNKNKRTDRQYQRATRNVQLEIQPQIDALNSILQQTQQDQLRENNLWQSVGGGYQDELAALPRTDYGAIANDLTSRLAGLGSMYQGQGIDMGNFGVPVGLPDSEVQAAQTLGATLGAGGLEALSSYGAREGAAREAAGREGALVERYGRDALQQRMQDTMQTYRNQLANIHAQTPTLIDAEYDQIRQQAIENKLANSQIAGDKAFSQYLQDMIGRSASTDPRRNNQGPGPGRPGPGPNAGRPPQGPGGQYGGISDTNAGGNQFGAPQPTRPPGIGADQIPGSWRTADRWNELPQIVRAMYTRPAGSTKRELFESRPHGSFQGPGAFQDFNTAYRNYRTRINQLYRQSQNPTRWNGGRPVVNT